MCTKIMLHNYNIYNKTNNYVTHNLHSYKHINTVIVRFGYNINHDDYFLDYISLEIENKIILDIRVTAYLIRQTDMIL